MVVERVRAGAAEDAIVESGFGLWIPEQQLYGIKDNKLRLRMRLWC